VEVLDWWTTLKPGDGKSQVEEVLGPLQKGELCDLPFNKALGYASQDADATLQVYHKLWCRIQSEGLEDVFRIDMDTIPLVLEMMETGIPANKDKLIELGKYFGEQAELTKERIEDIAGGVINPGSHDDVRELLFTTLDLKSTRTTHSNILSTDAKALGQLMTAHPVVPLIRDYREYIKLKSTYAEVLPEYIEADGRIRCTINITRTDTGRLSTKSPNLMGQPVKSEEGKKIRMCYEAPDDFVFMSGDYSQIELRVLAEDADEEAMKEVYRRNEDIHTATACRVFGLPASQIDAYKHRSPAKRVNFGIPYGITAKGLYETMLSDGADASYWTISMCQDFMDAWFNAYPNVNKYIAAKHAQARRFGYVTDMFGRRKFTPGAKSRIQGLINEALRQAQNQPIQSAAQNIMKIAMGKLRPVIEELRNEGALIYPVIQIHDDILWLVHEKDLAVCSAYTVHVMSNAVKLSIPTPVDPQYGKVWGGMKDIND